MEHYSCERSPALARLSTEWMMIVSPKPPRTRTSSPSTFPEASRTGAWEFPSCNATWGVSSTGSASVIQHISLGPAFTSSSIRYGYGTRYKWRPHPPEVPPHRSLSTHSPHLLHSPSSLIGGLRNDPANRVVRYYSGRIKDPLGRPNHRDGS